MLQCKCTLLEPLAIHIRKVPVAAMHALVACVGCAHAAVGLAHHGGATQCPGWWPNAPMAAQLANAMCLGLWPHGAHGGDGAGKSANPPMPVAHVAKCCVAAVAAKAKICHGQGCGCCEIGKVLPP